MKILTISGSVRINAKNQQLLNYLPVLLPQYHFADFALKQLPLFYPEAQELPPPESIDRFLTIINNVQAVIFSTPAYLHNIPAVLKNALEWMTTSGVLKDKPVLAITYTPHAPRGSKAMQSLLWSLTALDARIVTSLALYHTDIAFDEQGNCLRNNEEEMLLEAIKLLGS